MADIQTGHFRGAGGTIIAMDLPLPEVYADQVVRGQLVRVNADGSKYDGAAAGPEEGAAPTGPPSPGALKADWVGWAVACGMPLDDAEAATKQDLIEKYGAAGS